MDTFDPLRSLMLDVKVLRNTLAEMDSQGKDVTNGKRAWGFVISSGKNKLWLEIASAGLK
jgi:hypothetical protein